LARFDRRRLIPAIRGLALTGYYHSQMKHIRVLKHITTGRRLLRPYAEFLAGNPAGFTPAIQDGYVTMV
jgi:hypothetical protein